jgi:hypothetical protein
MTMSEQRVIMVAMPVETEIKELEEPQASSVNRAIERIGIIPGEPVDLPTADPARPYYAVHASDPRAPFVIYRQTREGEQGDWLVVSLMTPEEYRQQKADEQSGILNDPAIRQEIRVAAGTAATVAVKALAGTLTATQGGAAPTTGPVG